MALDKFIPEIWSANVLVALRKAHVAAALVNTDYEGDIARQGDTVHVPSLAAPTIGTYTKHTNITVEDLDDTELTLVIDQSKYFAFEIDDIEKAQQIAGGDALAKQLQAAAYGLRNVSDAHLLALMTTAAQGTANDLGTVDVSGAGGNALVYDALVDLSVLLDEANVPEEDRWVVVSPSLHGRLRKDDRFISAGDDPSAATRANGRIGEVSGLQVHKSNNLPAVTDAAATAGFALAGYRGAASFAEQIVSVEGARMELRFADMVKGLHVYGSKVFRPTGLAVVEFDGTAA